MKFGELAFVVLLLGVPLSFSCSLRITIMRKQNHRQLICHPQFSVSSLLL
jgi:hypothetical protein